MRALRKILKILDVVLESLYYLTVHFVLMSCQFAFQNSIVFVLFATLSIILLSKYWDAMQKLIANRILCISIIALFTILYVVFVYYFGYLDVAPTLQKW